MFFRFGFFFGFLIRITQSRDQKTCSLEDVFITNSPLFGGLAVYAFAKATQAHATMGVVANKFFPPLAHKGPLRCFFWVSCHPNTKCLADQRNESLKMLSFSSNCNTSEKPHAFYKKRRCLNAFPTGLSDPHQRHIDLRYTS